MEIKWLKKEHHPRLILFFNGWSMDEKAVDFLKHENHDIAMIYKYHPPYTMSLPFLSNYSQRILIAWSMGVWAASRLLSAKNIPPDFFCLKKAVNGTEYPADDRYGIPERLFRLTADNYSESTKEKFFIKAGGSPGAYSAFKPYLPQREAPEQKREIQSVYQDLIKQGAPCYSWDQAVISLYDKIIPPKNMIRFWNSRSVPYSKVRGSHYFFAKHRSWQEIIDL